MGPYGLKIAKSFRFDKLGAGSDDTWLGKEAPRRKKIRKRGTVHRTIGHEAIIFTKSFFKQWPHVLHQISPIFGLTQKGMKKAYFRRL